MFGKYCAVFGRAFTPIFFAALFFAVAPSITVDATKISSSSVNPAYLSAQELVSNGAFPQESSLDQPLARDEALLLVYKGLGLAIVQQQDTDNDGISDLNEFQIGTDPTSKDTDKDSYSDWHELLNGYDPLNKDPRKKNTIILFKDVKFDSWQHDLAYQARADKLISGYTDGTFRAAEPVLFAEFIKIAITASGLELVAPTTNRLTNIESNHWSLPYLETAAHHGLLDNKMKGPGPEQAIGSIEAAEIIYRLGKR